MISEYEKQIIQYHQQKKTSITLQKFSNCRQVSTLAGKFPLLKMLKIIQRKFMFNELEIYTYCYFLDKCDWNYLQFYDQKIISDLLVYVEVYDYAEFQSFQMFLIMIAFKTKHMMNQNVYILQNYLENMIPDFMNIFSQWHKDVFHFFEINNKEFNKSYLKFAQTSVDEMDYFHDYNTLVDSIIQISPPNKVQRNDLKIKNTPQNDNQSNYQTLQNNNYNNSSNLEYMNSNYDYLDRLSSQNKENIYLQDDNINSDNFSFTG